MAGQAMRAIRVEAVLNDPYDGAVRLLGDTQRFGFELENLALAAGPGDTVSATLVLRVPIAVDAQLVATRLARHPAVRHVDASALLECARAVIA